MANIVRYLLVIVFIPLAISFALRGFKFGVRKPLEKQNYKSRAIYYSLAVVCGLISFGLYYLT